MRMLFILFAVALGILLLQTSCKHDPILPKEEMVPIDTTTNPVDTMITNPVDTMQGQPCDEDKVYFEKDILPILQSNCAFSGCHDAASAEDGVILDSYENVIATADVEPFNLEDSEIFEVLIDTRETERMPPTPTSRLPSDQVQLIATWILQGGENLICDPEANGCDTIEVSFIDFVEPTIQTHCKGCHSGMVPSGNIDLSDYANIKSHVESGKLYGAISWEQGFVPMPQGLDQLSDCTLEKLKAWIDDGALNN